MTQYLIRTLTDSTNHTFTEVIKPRENERYEIVSAESKAKAEEMVKKSKGLLSYIPSSFNNGPISKAFSEASVNVNGQRGISKSLTNEQVQKLIELAKEKKGQ